MLKKYAFSQLGISIKSKDNSAMQYYFDALSFGEMVCTEDDAGIYFAIKDTLNSLGIPELFTAFSQEYDEKRFKIYKDSLAKYIPEGNETRVTVPEGVKSIRPNAFRELPGITTIDLPESLEEINRSAFYRMPDLTEVNISHNLKQMGFLPFFESRIENECDGMLIIGGWLVKCNMEADVIRIPENVIGICCEAFDGSLKSAKVIILPPGIKEIAEETFYGFSELEKINLPEGLEFIGSHAFSDCINLKEIIMPDTIVNIGAAAFQCCDLLQNVRFSDNITKIKGYTFVCCASLEELHLPKNLRSIGEDDINAFSGCDSLKKIIFPENLEYIGECAFESCDELEEIVLPNSIKKIDNMAFAGCEKLKKVHLPDHEVEIAENAFEDTLWENE